MRKLLIPVVFLLFITLVMYPTTNKAEQDQKPVRDELTTEITTRAGVAKVIEYTATPAPVKETEEPVNKYYKIPEEYIESGGNLDKDMRDYLYNLCEEKNLEYPLVLALIERESGYDSSCIGDDGNSLGIMQIYRKYHLERMDKENVNDLMDPYQNMRVGTTFLQELFRDYGESGTNCVLMVYNMGSGRAHTLWRQGIYSSEYSREIIKRSQEIEQDLQQEY